MYNKQIKKVIIKLYKNLVREQQKGSLLCSLNKPVERASMLTGLKRQTIKRWIKEGTETSCRDGQKKSTKLKSLDNFDIDVIMRKVDEMFAQRIVITLRKLRTFLKEDSQLDVGKTTLWKIMKSKGFAFKKTGGNRRVLCERHDLQVARCKYLRALEDVRKRKLNLVYLDETWIGCNHTSSKEWMSKDGTTARLLPTGRGQRLILLHAVDNTEGFLPDCKLLFKSLSTDGRDFHKEMNSMVFEDWVEHNLLPSLPEPSCIIMDNASYHSRLCPESVAPTMTSKKEEMKTWLHDHNIGFTDNQLKPEIYSLIKENKPKKEFVVDKLIDAWGHVVLRLPPYHCNLNPIELLWANIKSDVANNNSSFKLDDMKRITDQAIRKIPLDTIQKTFNHTEGIEKEYWKKDGLSKSPIVQKIVINVQDNTSSESSSSSSDENE